MTPIILLSKQTKSQLPHIIDKFTKMKNMKKMKNYKRISRRNEIEKIVIAVLMSRRAKLTTVDPSVFLALIKINLP